MNNIKLIGITPFELPDLKLLKALSETSIFPVLHIGRNSAQTEALYERLNTYPPHSIGLCFSASFVPKQALPRAVSQLILPFGTPIPFDTSNVSIIYQIHTLEEALQAKDAGSKTIIIKGNESAGKIAGESTFILFQRVMQCEALKNMHVWVQGGVGIHTAVALVALGATGLVLDSQLALYPACSAPRSLKKLIEKLHGNETRTIDGYRVLVRPNSPLLPDQASDADLAPYLNGYSIENAYLPMGQDITLAKNIYHRFGTLPQLAFGLRAAISGQIKQAKAMPVISAHNPMAQSLGITYPIAQGPMTRVSDVPEFAAAVASNGALPFVALSLMTGAQARTLLTQTAALLKDQIWGIGMLGFASSALREEQTQYILDAKPSAVLIAGGRPSQAAAFEKAGIKTFLHAPSSVLLDIFIKEGARRFIFEGRECGGHVGPLSSLVLWEQQIARILDEENGASFELFFAGGIHDCFSSTFISIMTAPLAMIGAKIGVLMGTAYLYTKEAVSTGAILPTFQQQAIEQKQTVLLETAPGHETRCLPSPFTVYFEQEKNKLITQGIDKKQIWQTLEELNVGRLRIASKGIERQNDALQPVNQNEQLEKGMYMIGQVAALNGSIQGMKALHESVVESYHGVVDKIASPSTPSEKGGINIAIIGMACVYPDSPDLDAFWQHILEGKDCIREVPDERWNKAIYYDPQDTSGRKSPSKWGGFIPSVAFDPLEFGIPPQSLAAIDPVQLLSLLVAKRALADAGYVAKEINKENVSVILGAEGGNDLANNYSFRALFPQIFGQIPDELDAALPQLTEDSFPGVLANVIAGRITNRLDLGGRNYTVDAACASSLAAVDLACQELILRKSDLVIAGAADLHNGINDYLMFASTHALSKKGRCATFDESADGIALGEGVAMLVLKRLEDAQQDGDRIYAVINGIGGSSDGKSLGLTAPRLTGQVRALERAYNQAGISPAEVGLIEAHGTGTVVGDRTELTALTQTLFRSGAVYSQTHLGSVKTQIGHTKCAAGMAGIIKSALSVYHGIKPPTIHLKQPNSYYQANSPFTFTDKAIIWPETKRIAGISAFGFGGTNFHAVISNVPKTDRQDFTIAKHWPMELLVFRGKDRQEAFQLLHQVKRIIEVNAFVKLKDLAYSLAVYHDTPIQLSILAENISDLLFKIDLVLSGTLGKDTHITQRLEGKTAFLFPGQGSQRLHMARTWMVYFPALRHLFDQYPTYSSMLFPNQAFDEQTHIAQQDKIRDTRIAQPLLGMVDLAIANFLKELGIMPDMLAGHSYGELPALAFAGVFDYTQLVPLSIARAEAICKALPDDPGAMVAVHTDETQAKAIQNTYPNVYAVNHNSPQQWVFAGTTAAIQGLIDDLKEKNIAFRKLEVSGAFHSPLLNKAAALYENALEGYAFKSPDITVWSNTTALPYPSEPAAIKQRLTEHLINPVCFHEQILAMHQDGARIFIEVGPGKTLTSLTRAILASDEVLLHTEDKGKHAVNQLLSILAQYLATGRDVKLTSLFEGRDAQIIDLNNPEKMKASQAIWLVDGQKSSPLHGKLPAYSAPPIVKPIIDLKNLQTSQHIQHSPAQHSVEQLTLEYLASMKALIQAQRDVLLAYLGQQVPPQHPIPIAPIVAVPPTQAAIEQVAAIPPIKRDIATILLDVVSEKTGYPKEMLGMDLDLEADLSIDSIKRLEIIGALRSELNSFHFEAQQQGDVMEELAAIKTLNGLLHWFRVRLDENANEPEKNHENPVAPITSIPDRKTLQQILLETVSEKTGYPEDMLGLDLDLEADLSIDSIKRIEIISELKGKLVDFLPAQLFDTEQIEKLSSFKTLRHLIDWLCEDSEPSMSSLKRIKFELTPIQSTKRIPDYIRGKKIAITRDGELGGLIKHRLEELGAQADLVNENIDLADYDGLVILDMVASHHRLSIMEAVELVKSLDMHRVKWVYVVSDHAAHVALQDDPKFLRSYQGYTGFIKSLDREYENAKCRTIHFMENLNTAHMTELLVEELEYVDEPAVIYYNASGRQTVKETPESLSLNKKPFELEKGAVVLVLGGAQGITAALTTHLATEYPCHYILIGRSPYPEMDQLPKHLQTREEIRHYLIQQKYAQTPAAIEQQVSKLFKSKQILDTIATIETSGSTASYYAIDVRDEEAFTQLIQHIYTTYGRIDGVIHGAGILEDKLFQDKTPASFERVFSTKVTPLRVLAEHLRSDVQFVVFFSSIASVYGNRGQTDYAAANSVLDHYAETLRKKMHGRVMAINWGPWKGAGMVSPTLEKEYERRGISLIPLESGKETFANEIKYGEESRVLIMA